MSEYIRIKSLGLLTITIWRAALFKKQYRLLSSVLAEHEELESELAVD